MTALERAPAAVTESLRAASRVSDLRPERRLDAKIGMSSAAVTRRLRVQSKLRDACLAWHRVGIANGLAPRSTPAAGDTR